MFIALKFLGYALDPSVTDTVVTEKLIGDTQTAEEMKGTPCLFVFLKKIIITVVFCWFYFSENKVGIYFFWEKLIWTDFV